VAPSAAAGSPGAADPPHLAALRWEPAAGRVTYEVEREQQTDLLGAGGRESAAAGHTFAIHVAMDGHVGFVVDDSVRWRSSLRLTGAGLPLHRVRLWLGGRDGGDVIALDEPRVVVGGEGEGR